MKFSHYGKGFNYLLIFLIASLVLMGCGSDKKPEVKRAKTTEKAVKVSYKVPEGSENWPSFRGVRASGVTENQNLPLNWDAESGKNIKWVVKTQGLGLSSPVVWGNRVFITTAINTKSKASVKVGLYGDGTPVKNDAEHLWEIMCLDRDTGKVLWKQESSRGVPKIKRHVKSSHANCTPATDGENVVAFFGSEGIYCYDIDGKLKWKRNLGTLDAGAFDAPHIQWEFGSSPVIHEGVVIALCDVQDQSFIIAMDINSGKTVWRTNRDENPTWGTPTIYEGKQITQIVVNGYKHIGSYDLNTGKPVWWMKGGGDVPVPTPVIAFGHAYITNSHGKVRPIYAVNLQARGNISLKKGETRNQGITWSHLKKGAYMPTPVLYGDYLYVCKDNGILSCYEAKSGKEIYKERVAGKFSAYTASPVAADGKLYFPDEYGTVHVIEAGSVYNHLASNKLGESVLASPAISGGIMFVRTIGYLFAISGSNKKSDIKN